jgi:trehalose-phosphatase
MLDYDGTLAPFCIERDKAYPYPGVSEVLTLILDAGNTRLVIISGRKTDDLILLLGLKRLPEIWGAHGCERLMPDGTYEAVKLDERTVKQFEEVDGWFKREGLERLYEKKPVSRALHVRGLEPKYAKEIKSRVLNEWSLIADKGKLVIQEFNGGIELNIQDRNKGFAVETILTEMGDGTFAAYLGDDITDEDAFRAIKGRGTGILVRENPHDHNTYADFQIKPPDELLDFLIRWEKVLRGSK